MDLAATHQPILAGVVMESQGPVVELGMGFDSTPLLHALCYGNHFLLSVDSDPEWTDQFRYLESRSHTIRHSSYDDVDFSSDWGVAFIDHAPALRRIVDIPRLVHADFLVVHDYEYPGYEYSKIEHLFKEIMVFRKFNPWTAVLSNKSLVEVNNRLKDFI